MRYHLQTPITEEIVRQLEIGDVIFVTGIMVSCRDAGHRRVLEYINQGKKLPIELSGLVVYHAGPIVIKRENVWEVISAGPTTSARMEMYEAEFIEKTGVRIIVGKGGMGKKTAEACQRFGAIYAIFPGGAGALAAKAIEKVERVEWLDLGMPEAMWVFKVKNFGPLMVIIDAHGKNFYEIRKELIKKNLQKAYSLIE